MGVIKDKYEKILEQFELYYPNFYSQAVDWWASGRMSIGIKLRNGEVLDYDHMENSIRWIRYDNRLDDEEFRRKTFSHNLQKMIPFTGMSKGEIAERLGITNAMLSRYITGKSIPSVDKAYQLARLLGCTTDELFDDNYMNE